MDQKISKLQEEIEQLDEKMQIVIAKGQALQARRRKKENANRSRKRSQRTHRLISIGAEVESVMERQIPKEDLPAFREYMEKAESVIGAFRVVDGRCSFLMP